MWTEIIYLEREHYNDDYIFNYSLSVYAIKLANNSYAYSIHSETPSRLTEFHYDNLGEMFSSFETRAKSYLNFSSEKIMQCEFIMMINL